MSTQTPVDLNDPNSNNRCYIVGIGASAGGLQALGDFFSHLPEQKIERLAFVVVQHLSPDYKSLMVELLAKHTPLRVLRAEDMMEVETGHIYVLPPKKNVVITKGHLQLINQPELRGVNLPIDVFLRSLAEDLGDRAVGIVLSGTGTDGTQGVRAIKGAGGMVMVQDPISAKFDGMPRSAISTRIVDFVLPADQLGEKLAQYAEHPTILPELTGESTFAEGNPQPNDFDTDIRRIIVMLKNHAGVDFSRYRPNTFLRRINKRMQMHQIDRLEDYVDYMYENRHEVGALYDDVLINVTQFFRDTEAFNELRRALPAFLKERASGDTIRVWSAGCSTGEEPYSMAMLLTDIIEEQQLDLEIKIFATDVDSEALRFASQGLYPESSAADVPPHMLKRYLTHRGDAYQINDRIRKKIIFSMHNLTADPPFYRIDLISCRNLLIYLRNDMQDQVMKVFTFALEPGGLLFLGSSETLGEHVQNYQTINHRWKLYQRREDVERPRLTSFPLNPQTPRSYYTTDDPQKASHRSTLKTKEYNLFKAVMERFSPATIVIDELHQIQATFGDVRPFLSLPVGMPKLDLLNMLPDGLSVTIASAVHRAKRSDERAEYRFVEFVTRDGDTKHVHIIVEPFRHQTAREKLFVLVLKPQPDQDKDTTAPPIETSDIRDTRGSLWQNNEHHVNDLKQELQYTKENLQALIEELETSNEELQATNEELLASNEELQSTNEELQSVNEELITVNAEHQYKIEELTELNNDMDNLLANTNVGVIFLDRRLHIRKFTPGVKQFITLLQTDLGRPIAHFSLQKSHYDSLVSDATRVLETLIPVEHEISRDDGGYFLIRIVPYRTTDDAIKGVIIIFVDVTDLRRKDEVILSHKVEIERLRERQTALVGGAPLRIMLVEDDQLDIEFCSQFLKRSKIANQLDVYSTLVEARARLDEVTENPELRPDLLLLDLQLPDGDGWSLLSYARDELKLSELPIVIVSAIEDIDAARNRAIATKANSFIHKPLNFEQLKHIVESIRGFWFSIVKLPDNEEPLDGSLL